jgi:hypothetical protein
MPLILDAITQNISTSTGDMGVYTWPDIVAVGSSKMTSYANGSYRWEGILEMNGTSILNILEQDINLHNLGKIRSLENSVVNFGEKTLNSDGTTTYRRGCNIFVSRLGNSSEAHEAAISYSSTDDRNGTSSRVNLYNTRVYLKPAADQRITIFITNAADSVVAASPEFLNIESAICYFQINGSAIDTLFENVRLNIMEQFHSLPDVKAITPREQ